MARARVLGARAATVIDGDWQLAAFPPGSAIEPADLERLQPQWIACDGPMPVAEALRRSGKWDLEQIRDFDADDWWYRCRFKAASELHQPVRIRFEGLATIADVWLNGRLILHSASMFVAHTAAIDGGLEADNELHIRFDALAPLLAAKRPRPRWRTRLVSHQSLRWFRTSLLGRIPGWCPPAAPVGPWRPILIETAPLVIEHASLAVGLLENNGSVRLVLDVTVPAGVSVAGTLSVGEWSAPTAIEHLAGGEQRITASLSVPTPDRWWPHTHGMPALYPVHVSLGEGPAAETIDLGRIGFRTIEVDRGADGNGFGLVVNGAPVFCRGACWTPLDLASLAASPADYRATLERLRDAGMNMIRVGGTMTYEAGAFHDLCDELGILVWQDFMFANMDYPGDDDAFADLVELEAAQILEGLQSRPSLVVICGSSEVGQQAAMLGLPADRRRNPLFDQRLPELVEQIAPGTAWVPTTPSGGTFPFHADSGLTHYYGVGAYLRPFDDARRAGVRFASECLAFSNLPEDATISRTLRDGEAPGPHPRWKAGVPRDSGVGWDFEDVRDHYVERLFGVAAGELRARDPGLYLALGRVATGEAMLRTFAEWRRPGSTCRGGLVWFARDLRPGAGWGILDSVGEPKAAYWYLKRALAPIALLCADEGLNGLWLHAVNDTAESIEVDLRVALYRDGLMQGVPSLTTLNLPGRGSRSVHVDALFEGFLDLTYAYRFGPQGHDTIVATMRDRHTDAIRATACYFPATLPAKPVEHLGLTARLEPTGEGYTLMLAAERFAHAVAIAIDGWLPDDNYFVLEPGETKRVGLRRTGGGAVLRGHVQALNGFGPVRVTAAPVEPPR